MPYDLLGAGPFRQHFFLLCSTSAPVGPRSYFCHLKISFPLILFHTFFSSPFHSHLPKGGPRVRRLPGHPSPPFMLCLSPCPPSMGTLLPSCGQVLTLPVLPPPGWSQTSAPWLPGGPFTVSSSLDACTSPDSGIGLCSDLLLPLPGLLPPCSMLGTKKWTAPYSSSSEPSSRSQAPSWT